MGGTSGNYSNIIIYDEDKRYYYLNPQKNKPLLDDEIRNMHIAVMDQLRRSIQHTQGDIAVPLETFSTTNPTGNHFKVVSDGSTPNDFKVIGGNGIDNPAVMFLKGYYIFLPDDITYNLQTYGTSNVDLATNSDKSKTLTLIPDLTTPTEDRRDIVFIDLHFEEVTATSGADDEVYYDSSLLDPRIGTATANRLRAVFDIRVLEGWEGPIGKDIFEHTSFLGGIDYTVPPTQQHFRVPISVVYRESGTSIIDNSKVIDLLTMYDKRPMTLEEVSFRSLHGGYGESAVFETEGSFTGFNSQFPGAKLDEGAYATGLNQGFASEAFNTDSITPRAVDNDGKFQMGAIQVGVETGTQTYPVTAETGPEELNPGEVIAHEASFQHVALGYDRGITGKREYNDAVSIHTQGLTGVSINLLRRGITGAAGLSMHNYNGETGVYTQFVDSENYLVVDYKGRMGFNTATPGWDALPTIWNVERYVDPVNIVLDVNDSVRVREHLFIDRDTYTQGDVYGKTWSIPSTVDKENKAYFGYTGTPSYGLTGSSANVVIRPGIATQGLSGIEDYRGFTGVSGFYESYDKDGGRVFTIGDLGPEFDRVVKTLYGTGLVPLLYSDNSFRYLDTLGTMVSGDEVTATVDFLNGGDVTLSTITISGSNFDDAIEYLRSELESQLQSIASSADITVHILSDEYDEALPLADRIKNDGKIIIRDKLSEIQSIKSFNVQRSTLVPPNNNDDIMWTESKYYGSGSYGGDLLDFKFAKLDLGEAADAWLFNGDVFFNGDGLLNRVTFSPNVIFRDNIFVYGDLFANNLKFDRAIVNNLTVNQKLDALRYVDIGSGYNESNEPIGGLTLGVGTSGSIELMRMQRNQYRSLWLYVDGDAKAENFIADLCGTAGSVSTVIGNSFPRSNDILNDVYLNIGGSYTDTNNPYGLHLVDSRSGIDVTQGQGFRTLRIDHADGDGNLGQISVDLRGDLIVSNNTASRRITAGTTTPNVNYDLFVNNNARIEGTLEVENLRFIGTGTADELTSISEPQNAIIYKDGIKTVDNKPNGILRTKEFSIDQKVVLINESLGYNDDAVVVRQSLDGVIKDTRRVNYIQTGNNGVGYTGVIPTWVKDSMTYAAPELEERGGNFLDADTISEELGVTRRNDPEYRYSLDKITLATLGTIKMRYIGRIDKSAVSTNNITDFIQTYEFESPYFKDRDQGSVINWFADDQTTISNNFIATVDLSVIDDQKAFWNNNVTAQTIGPQIYNLNRPIWVYIPLSSWTHYRVWSDLKMLSETSPGTSQYLTIYLAQRWYHRLIGQNYVEMNKLVNSSVETKDKDWSLAVYPRFKSVTRTVVDVTEDQYDAEWDLNLIVTASSGTASDLQGRMFINRYK